MNGTPDGGAYYIGWDVGGWNCDKNPESRDALVILDGDLRIIGEPWRGNLRVAIAKAGATADWLHGLFRLCAANLSDPRLRVTMAIDTPLGFSAAFLKLATTREWTEPPGSSDTNPYLFRETERHLFRNGRTPLSAIKDMIGSQATKGMHALAKFAPIVESCGVWTDGEQFTAVEAYPSACRDSERIKGLLDGREILLDSDRQDALVCALVAHLFATDRGCLEPPDQTVPSVEGWIWVPRQSEIPATSGVFT